MHTDHTTDTTITDVDVLVDTYAAAGFLPADEFAHRWLGHYEAAIRTDSGWIVALAGDDEVTLSILTETGVIRSSVRFPETDLGLAMFAGAVSALVAVA